MKKSIILLTFFNAIILICCFVVFTLKKDFLFIFVSVIFVWLGSLFIFFFLENLSIKKIAVLIKNEKFKEAMMQIDKFKKWYLYEVEPLKSKLNLLSAISNFSLYEDEKFVEEINKVVNKRFQEEKLYWYCLYFFTQDDKINFANCFEKFKNSMPSAKRENYYSNLVLLEEYKNYSLDELGKRIGNKRIIQHLMQLM